MMTLNDHLESLNRLLHIHGQDCGGDAVKVGSRGQRLPIVLSRVLILETLEPFRVPMLLRNIDCLFLVDITDHVDLVTL